MPYPTLGGIRTAIQKDFAHSWFGLTTWRGPRSNDARDARAKIADNTLAIFAALLPWSTAATAVAGVGFLILAMPLLRLRASIETMLRPMNASIIVLALIAIAGLFWANDISWADRMRGLPPLGKLLFIMLLVYHFERSHRGMNILIAFVLSCAALMLYSSVTIYFPGLSINYKPDQPGVPIKNYIDQSQGFVFCIFALAAIAIEAMRHRNRMLAFCCMALAVAFVGNLFFVNVSRTALVTCPVIAAIFAWRYFSGRQFVATALLGTMIFLGAWAASPNLQRKISSIFFEYGTAATKKGPNSVAQRFEYWEKSIRFIDEAPIIGHGTGSNKILFARAEGASSPEGVRVISNPHNQTLYVAIQWGLLGVLALYAMWTTHLLVFRGSTFIAWIGLLAVVQNMLSCIFNSHLFDFYEGWLYALAVGVAAGTLARERTASKG